MHFQVNTVQIELLDSSSRTGSMQANAIQSITYQMILDGRCGDRGESDYRMSPLIRALPKIPPSQNVTASPFILRKEPPPIDLSSKSTTKPVQTGANDTSIHSNTLVNTIIGTTAHVSTSAFPTQTITNTSQSGLALQSRTTTSTSVTSTATSGTSNSGKIGANVATNTVQASGNNGKNTMQHGSSAGANTTSHGAGNSGANTSQKGGNTWTRGGGNNGRGRGRNRKKYRNRNNFHPYHNGNNQGNSFYNRNDDMKVIILAAQLQASAKLAGFYLPELPLRDFIYEFNY